MISARPGRARWQPPRAPSYDVGRTVASLKRLIAGEVPKELELARIGAWCDGMPALDFLADVSCCNSAQECPASSGPIVLANRRYGVPTLISTHLPRPFAGTSGPPIVTEAVMPAPANGTRLYVATDGDAVGDTAGVLLKSVDSGATWETLVTPWPVVPLGYGAAAAHALHVSPVDRRLLFLALQENGVYRSTDMGTTWLSRSVGIPAARKVNCLALSPSASSRAFIGLDNITGVGGDPSYGVWKTVNAGDSWIVTGMGTGYRPKALAVHPTNANIVYAGLQPTTGAPPGGVYRSANGGTSWTLKDTGLAATESVQCFAIHPTTPTTLYAGIYAGATGIYKSTDSGDTWSASAGGIPLDGGIASVFALAIDPVTPTRLYASVYLHGTYCSTDSGASWTQIHDMGGASIYTILVNALRPSHLYAAGDLGVFRSTDGGASWQSITAGLPASFAYTIAIDPTTP